MISASDLNLAFPFVKPGVRPLGARVLVQIRAVRKRTSSGIVLAQDTRDFNRDSGQYAKVLNLGPLAYCNRSTGEKWPEGLWVKVGDIVRVPKYGGDRMAKELPDGEVVVFAIFEDHVIGSVVELDEMTNFDELL